MEKLHNENNENKGTLANDTSVNLENANVKPERNKSKLSKEKKILAGVALTLAVGIGGGMAANFAFNHHPASAISASSSENVSGNNNTSETSSNNEASSANNSSETGSSSQAQEVLPTVESLELDGSLASNLNNVGKAFCDELTNWLNSGATDADIDKDYKIIIHEFDGNTDKFAQQEAAKYDALYEKALFGDVSSADDTTTIWLKNITKQHEGVLKDFLSTSGNAKTEGEDIEPYKLKVNFKSAGGLTWMGSSTLQLCSYNSDNSDKNTVGKVESSNVSPDENHAIAFKVENGKIKITKVN
ncbi:MAG: hypothetical protein ABF497_04265 [Sporolactobacillus sp.]